MDTVGHPGGGCVRGAPKGRSALGAALDQGEDAPCPLAWLALARELLGNSHSLLVDNGDDRLCRSKASEGALPTNDLLVGWGAHGDRCTSGSVSAFLAEPIAQVE